MTAWLLRVLAFVRKEVLDVVRQPLLLIALVIGPFLILFAFGAGLREADPPLRTALVVDQDSELRPEVEEFADDEIDRERLVVEGITEDQSAAMSALAARELELVIVFPDEVSETVQEDEQAIIDLYHNEIDPIESQAITLFSRTAVHELNNQLLTTIVADLQESARERDPPEGTAHEEYTELNPEVLVSPFHGNTQALTGSTIGLADFYAPAVLVVLLQHLAVTLLALSVVRERALGATQVFRVSPLRTSEYLAGKFLAYLVLGGAVGSALVALLVFGLGTPMRGSWWQLTAVLAVLLLTATAVGLVIALLANTDSQAVQYSMLVLLATIFLSGFLLSLERFIPVARPLSWALPATYGIDLVRDVMLRGASLDPWVITSLAAYGAVFAVAGALLVRRRINSPGI